MWLLAVVPLLALGWYWIKRTQSGSGWENAVDADLLAVLLDGSHRRKNRWLGISMIATLIAASIGISGPTWEKLPQSVEQKNDALVIVLDLSLSMLAQDVNPSRVERARQEVVDILRLRDEGQTALVVYGGDAHAVVPLTDDTATIENLLGALSPEMMPVYGSNPDHAIEIAHQLFANNKLLQGRIVMITDGIDDISSVSRHRSTAFPISIIGIGTEQGAPIPLDRLRQPGRFYQTQEGNRVIALLDEARLREVAGLTWGHYATAVLGDTDILYALSTRLPSEDETLEVEREFDTWFDQGHWLALLVLPFCLFAFRRGVLVCLTLCLMLPFASPPAVAQVAGEIAPSVVTGFIADAWNSLWMRDDQRGYRALRGGEPEKAAVLFEDDPDWRSVAQYRSGDYNGAFAGFKADPTVTGRYNEGNALARMGEFQAAIDQYEQVLAAQPDHADAAFNKELVERLLEEQQQAEQQQNQDQQSQANNENSESQQDQQNEPQDQSEQQDQSEESEQEQNKQAQQEQEEQDGEQSEAEAQEEESTRDEKQDALEQWLRRVPDDPGGLLRRKFSHETKQRLRRGEYENRQGEKLW
jgi:Ca-activated chloride channel family protein